MDISDKIFVAGHCGLAGSAMLRRLRAAGYSNLITRTRSELDLTDQTAVRHFFREERPAYVFFCAAKVGGIIAHRNHPASFIYENLRMQTNVLDSAQQCGVKKLLFIASSCVYPRLAPQPMREDFLLTGAPEPTNEAFAVAKIAGIKGCVSYNRQYGTNFLVVMAPNLYGPGASYDLLNAHVLPALVRKAHEAKTSRAAELAVWGTGRPLREFLYADDLADACIFLLRGYDAQDLGDFINVGTGQEISIGKLAEIVAQVVGFEGRLAFDHSKPDGVPRKVLDISRIQALGWRPATSYVRGIQLIYEDFLEQCVAAEESA